MFHSPPSPAAAFSASTWASDIGSRRMRPSVSVTGWTFSIAGLAVVLLHEDELLEQRHVLLVLEKRADQRRDRDLVVLGLQRRDRDVLRQQQLEPVEPLRPRRPFLQ